MTGDDEVTSVTDGEDAFARAHSKVAESAGPTIIEDVERGLSLPFVGRGTTRIAFRADTYRDGAPTVVKIAIDGRGGRRAVERERDLWQNADETQRELLAPVRDVDDQNRWLVLPAVEVGVSPVQAHEFHRRLTAAGLAMRDVTPGDIGFCGDNWMLVDYAGCKPIEHTPVTKAKMKEIVDRRWCRWTELG
jgi:hypothetical protein